MPRSMKTMQRSHLAADQAGGAEAGEAKHRQVTYATFHRWKTELDKGPSGAVSMLQCGGFSMHQMRKSGSTV